MVNRDSLLVFFIGVVVFTIGLSPEFIGFNCRFAVFAKEMLHNGPTFFPTTYGQPYPDYTGASTLMIYLASLPFSKVTPFTSVLPTAIVSALILVFIYRIGAIRSRNWGLFAVLFALCTIEFFNLSRSVSTDQYTALATVMCFYIVHSATVYNRQKRLLLIPFLFMFGFVFRGPIGLIIPASVVCAYYLYNRDFENFAFTACVSAILLVAYSLILLATAQYQGGETFVKQVIRAQVTGRLSGDAKHWLGYYFVESFGRYTLSYPFAVVVIAVLHKKIFARENGDYRLLGSLVIWIIVVLVGMSIPSARKIRYVLPMIPAVALVGSYLFVYPSRNNILSEVKKTFLQFCSWFPLGVVVFSLLAWVSSSRYRSLLGGNYPAAIIPAIILTIASWVLNIRLKNNNRKDLALLAVATVTSIIITICIVEPIDCYRNTTRPFVAKVEALRSQKSGEVVFYRIGADSAAIKFMANCDKQLKPQFVNNPTDILDFQASAYFIAAKGDFAALPKRVTSKIKVLCSGKIGHDDCIVFTCKTPNPCRPIQIKENR
jgi:4-amino-4-deoxy-L-arabinose transferase-like glycosyltransferase